MDEYINVMLDMEYQDLKMNWGDFGEGIVDAYGGHNMPNTVKKWSSYEDFWGLSTHEMYVKENDGQVNKIYVDLEYL